MGREMPRSWTAVLLVALVLATADAVPTKPTRLRANGSNLATHPLEGAHFAIARQSSVRFTWVPNHLARGASQAEYAIVIREASGLKTLLWESPVIASNVSVHLYTRNDLRSGVSYEWTVRYTDQNGVESPMSDPALFHVAISDWEHTEWLGSPDAQLYRSPVFPKHPDTAEATLYVCGLSYSAVSVNGVPVPNVHLVTAPWANGERINGFSSLNITSMLGDNNVVGVELGVGWRDQATFPNHDNDQGDDTTPGVVRAQVVLTLHNGTQVVATYTGDGKWTSSSGPVTASSVYNGEDYNAMLRTPGWDTPTGSPAVAGWPVASPAAGGGPKGAMVPWSAPAVQISAVLPPQSITEPQPGLFVVDFGANLAGVCRLKQIKCNRGAVITMRHGEIMQHAGIPDLKPVDPTMIYVGNLRSAKATDHYTCDGDTAGESFAPRFTYHGFRFAEINMTTAGSAITKDNIELLHFHTANAPRANISFSSPTLNTLQTMAAGAQRSNSMTVPTDCDQRDERLGWMGDANLSGESIALNFDATAFLKFFVDLIVSETDADGSIPDVVPYARYGNRPADVSWSAAFLNLLHVIYKVEGDIEPAKTHWDAVVRQLDNVAGQAAKGLGNMSTPYGDWCPPPSAIGGGQGTKPSKPYTSAFSYVNMVAQAVELATAAGNTTEATRLTALHTSLVSEFNTAFANEDGTYDASPTQTALALALALGAPANVPATQAALLNELEGNKTHFTTGIIGARFLFDMLADSGHADTSLAVLNQLDYPSLGFFFANEEEKATTNLWEITDALGEGVGMNSRNHHMWSSYSSYLVRKVAGIDQAAHSAGHASLLLRPASHPGLSAANASLPLPLGTVELAWQRTGGLHTVSAAEGHVAEISCGPDGGVIESVEFASFGTPDTTGKARQGACHWESSQETVEHLCLNATSCRISSSASTFSSPPSSSCSKHARGREQPLRLAVRAVCSAAPGLVVRASVPVTSVATVVVPVGEVHSPVIELLGEDGGIVFAKGQANKVLPKGVTSASLGEDGHVYLELGSGHFHFEVRTRV